MTPVLVDTGPLVAILRKNDAHHETCVRHLHEIPIPAFTCWPVITEAAYLLRKDRDAVMALLSRCDGSRFEILPLTAFDVPGVTAILEKYRDQNFDLADVSLMYLAEREGIEHVFTLDRRDFPLFRTAAGKRLAILPE